MKNQALFFLISLGMITLFTNCQKDDDNTSEGMLDEPFSIDFEFRTQVTDELTLSFVAVEGDSRCPCEAFCITAGSVGVKIKMETNDMALTKLFTLGGLIGPPEEIFETDFEGYHIELQDVLPYPCNGQPNSDDDYSIKVLVMEL